VAVQHQAPTLQQILISCVLNEGVLEAIVRVWGQTLHQEEVGIGALTPILRVHRPYFSDTDLRTLSANQAMASATQVRTIVETYLKEMGVPAKYADLMFSIPKDQVRWIDEADLKSDFTGVIPGLKDWLDARCDKRTDVDKRVIDALDAKSMRGELTEDEQKMYIALMQKFLEPQADCEGRWKDKLREDAWNSFKRF
jgi:hypothetical protein